MSLERLMLLSKKRGKSRELIKRLISVLTKMGALSLVLKGVFTEKEVREVIAIAYQMRNRLAHSRIDLNDLTERLRNFNFKSLPDFNDWLEHLVRHLIRYFINEMVEEGIRLK